MHRSFALFALLLLGAAPAPRPQRIVSLNLCADQLLLALADRGQIVALTQFARDPSMSAAAGAARGVPVTRGSAEEVLALRPDLVVAAPGWRTETMARLRERGVATLDLPAANTYGEIVAQTRTVARAVGQAPRGEALVARMDRALARLPRNPGGGAVAAYYQRRGFLTGAGTLVDELIQRAGLRNLATRLGRPALSRIGLEELVLARPDYLLVDSESDRVADQGTEMLHHPLLGRIPKLRLRQAWTVCGGPAYVTAAQSLSDQLVRARRR